MPLTPGPLPLEPSPRSVRVARQWTSAVIAAMGRSDLCESAELGVSELVTNALLHARPPLSVRVRGTRDHPRIEVADGSPETRLVPGPASAALDLDVRLRTDAAASGPPLEEAPDPATLGRGLGIVSMCASAWGADTQHDGKLVWFEPVGRDETGVPAAGAIFTRVDDLARAVSEEPLSPVVLRGVPVVLYAGLRRHVGELGRELRLLALSHASEYPLAANLGTLLTDFEAHLRQADLAEPLDGHAGPSPPGGTDGSTASDSVDVSMDVPRSAPEVVGQMIDLLDLADAFCHDERLLSLARAPVQRQFQRWFLSEVVRQAQGWPPTPWGGAGAGQNAS